MISTEIKNISLSFQTEPTVFSPKAIDTGTLAMLSVADFSHSDKVLDLGCGYGVVGIFAGKLIGKETLLCVIFPKRLCSAQKSTQNLIIFLVLISD